MSGSRGEANFVWKCKNCKVLEPVSVSGFLRWPNEGHWDRGSPRQPSKPPQRPTRKPSRPSRRKSSSSTAGAWSLPSFCLRFVAPRSGKSISDGADYVQGEWLVDGADSNTKFEGVELTEGEWFDYDEKAGDEVSIKDLKWDIVRA